ncbi:MAG: PAS domain-containing protein, partial [Bacteroidia bacterium]|nr:PAS domain-containing protein [Bacteroidia bacterium]
MNTKDYINMFEQSSEMLALIDTKFNLVNVSNAFLKGTKTKRENIIGKDIFNIFPSNPNDLEENSEGKIRDSFNRVLKNKTHDTLPVVKYYIPKPESEGGGYELKYWQATSSPILDENDNVKYIIHRTEDVIENKILIGQLEFDKKVLKLLEDSEKRHNMMLMKSPFGFASFKGKDMVITFANDTIKEIWGKGNDVEGKPLFDVLPELRDTPYPGLLGDVYTTGVPFQGNEILASFLSDGKIEDKYFNLVYQPYLKADETILGVTVIANEVTTQVILKKALDAKHEAELKALKKIEESNNRYYMMLMESPFAFSIMKGKDMVITLANSLMKEFWGKGTDVEGKTMLQVLPELIDQPFPEMIEKVYTTGIPVYANEILAKLTYNGQLKQKYFNVVFQPYYEADNSISGVTQIAYDVTEMILARKKIEESDKRYNLMLMHAPFTFVVLKGKDLVV